MLFFSVILSLKTVFSAMDPTTLTPLICATSVLLALLLCTTVFHDLTDTALFPG